LLYRLRPLRPEYFTTTITTTIIIDIADRNGPLTGATSLCFRFAWRTPQKIRPRFPEARSYGARRTSDRAAIVVHIVRSSRRRIASAPRQCVGRAGRGATTPAKLAGTTGPLRDVCLANGEMKEIAD
jgi:hypothetical protein